MTFRLTGRVQPYAWGDPTFIPRLLGTEPTGEPQAELWLGAHPSAPSRLEGAGVDDTSLGLDEAIAANPGGVLGGESLEAFGSGLPFLLKVLAAAKPLSLQAHPSRTEAEAGFAREEAAGVPRDAGTRLYKDDWPKPEMLCALVDSEALCGFRDPTATAELFDALGSAEASALVAPLSDAARPAQERLAEVFARLLRLAGDERAVVGRVAATAGARLETAGSTDGLELFCRTAVELHEHYGDDPGVLAALLLNRVPLAPGQAVFLAAGNLHAYLRGGGVEIMANSDNVMRGGLTPKHVDVDELLAILDFTPGFPGYVEAVEERPGRWRYPTPAPEFALWRIEPTHLPVELPAIGSPRVLLVTDGHLTVSAGTTVAGGDPLTLDQGQAAFAKAGEDLRVSGSGTVYVAGPGLEV